MTQTISRAQRIVDRLKAHIPDAHCALEHGSPLELLVATILSAQCTDKRVNLVTKDLFGRYRTAVDYANASLPELEEIIRTTGFFRNKAKSITGMARGLVERFGGEVPRTLDELVTLDGVGRKTANVVLGVAFGVPGVVVDTHVRRLVGRMGLTRSDDPDQIEQDLMPQIAKDDWIQAGHVLIWHGRRCCSARKPDCPACPVADLCPSDTSGRYVGPGRAGTDSTTKPRTAKVAPTTKASPGRRAYSARGTHGEHWSI